MCSNCQYMFTYEHLSDLSKVDWSLPRNCDSDLSHAYEKVLCYYIFDMWLAHNGISNLMFQAQLGNDGFYVTYDTLKSWIMNFPDGIPILFK